MDIISNTNVDTSVDTSTLNDQPIWMNVVKNIQDLGVSYGDFISKQWVFEQLEIIDPNAVMTRKEFRDVELNVLQQLKAIENYFLHHHKMYFRNARKGGQAGWEIVVPEKHNRVATKVATAKVLKVLREASDVLDHVNTDALTQEQLQMSNEVAARFSNLKGAIKTETRKFKNLGRTLANTVNEPISKSVEFNKPQIEVAA